ncbi:MAG: FG-GAP repeat protein [Planctomycetes bacterium]|nr:FG-GAP repeat protein [Planctomycetota bacterium]
MNPMLSLCVRALVLVVAFAAAGPVRGQQVIYVNASAAPGGDGASWATAYRELQPAIGAAAAIATAAHPVAIWVAQGTYWTAPSGSGLRSASFELHNNVALLGGFAGSEVLQSQRDPVAFKTWLSGDISRNDGAQPLSSNWELSNDAFRVDNSRHVIYGSNLQPSAKIDGFIVAGGYANGLFYDADAAGGGMLLDGVSSPTITRCVFINNYARYKGGAILTHDNDSPVIANCRFLHNIAGTGGAIGAGPDNTPGVPSFGLPVVVNCVFGDNRSGNGGAVFVQGVSAKLYNCTLFQNNKLSVDFNGYLRLYNSIIQDQTWELPTCPVPAVLGGATFETFRCVIPCGGTGWNGTTNLIQASVQFVDAAGSDGVMGTLDDDLRLEACSGLADAGYNDFLDEAGDVADLDGDGNAAERLPLDGDDDLRVVDTPGAPKIGRPGPADAGNPNPPFVSIGAYENPRTVGPIYVRADAVPGGDGRSWATAFNSLQSGISAAATAFDCPREIWVAGGTYRAAAPGSGDSSGYVLPPNVAVYGGFAGTETSLSQRVLGPTPTILNGDINGNDIGAANRNDNTDPMIVLDAGCTLDGVIITNAGNGAGSAVLSVPASAEPMFVRNTTVTRTFGTGLDASPVQGQLLAVTDCRFEENLGESAVRVNNTGVALFRRCEFRSNSGAIEGGAAFIGTGVVFSQCGFYANSATDVGGAIWVNGGFAYLGNCRLSGNTAPRGGAVFVEGPNSAFARLDNCLVDNNHSTIGGAVWVERASGQQARADLDQTAVAFNTSGSAAAGLVVNGPSGYLSARNSIVWGNSRAGSLKEADQIESADPSRLSASFSLVQGWSGSYAGSSTQDADPLFFDPDGPDNIIGNDDDRFDHGPGSPAIDAASPLQATNDSYDLDEDGDVAEPWPFDLRGGLRFVDDPDTLPDANGPLDPIPVDIGPYEYAPICPACPVHRWLRADGGSFNLDANWLFGVPGQSNVALFDQPGSQTVTFSEPASVRALHVLEGGITLDLNGRRLGVNSGSGESLVVSGDQLANPSLTLTSSAPGGVLDSRLGKIGLAPGEYGTLTVSGPNVRLAMPLATLAVGTEGNGTLEVLNGATASVQILTVGEFPGSVGAIRVSGTSSKLAPKFGLNLFSGSVVVEDGGLIDLGTTGDVIVLQGASISGDGTIRSDVVNFGTIDPAPGSAARGTFASLSLIGDYEQVGVDPKSGAFSGTLRLNASGSGNSITSDALVVTGTARLAGTLIVEPVGGFNPSPSAPPASLLSAGVTAGRFDLAVFPGLTDNKFMRLAYPAPFQRGGSVSVSIDTLASNIDLDPASSASVSGQPTDLALGDLDADGDADLALSVPDAANPTTAPGQVVILRNAGNTGPGGSWAGFTGGQVTVNVGVNPRGIAAGRFNADTAPDLIVANFNSNTATVLTNVNNGQAAMSVTQTIPVGANPVAVVTGVLRDASGGAIDAAVANSGSDSVTVLSNTSGTLAVASTLNAGATPSDIALARLDAGTGSATLDIVVTNENDDTATVYYRPPGGTYPVSPSRVLPTSTRPVQVEPGGLDNPKELNDLAISNAGSGSVSILLNNNLPDALAGFQPKADLPAGTDPGSITLGDLDSDSDPDLSVVSTVGGQEVVRVFRNDAQEVSPGVYQAAFAPFGDQYAGLDPRLVTSGDVNNDGREDLIAVNDLAVTLRPGGSGEAAGRAAHEAAGLFGVVTRGIVTQPNVAISLNAAPFVPPPCVGDFTNDRAVNTADLVFFLGAFGKPANPPGSGADLNADATVNTADLVIFLGVFGQVCP